MAPAYKRAKQRRFSVRWSVGFLVLLLLHAMVVYVVIPKGSGYQPNWQSNYSAFLSWMILSVGCLPLAGLVGTIVAAVSRSSAHVIGSLILLVLGGVGGFSGVAMVGWLSMGGGPAKTVATAQNGTAEFRLDYHLAGDPTTTVYMVRECTLDDLWCRSLGRAYGYMGIQEVEPATIQPEPDGTLAIAIGGIVRAIIRDGGLQCLEAGTLCSPD